MIIDIGGELSYTIVLSVFIYCVAKTIWEVWRNKV